MAPGFFTGTKSLTKKKKPEEEKIQTDSEVNQSKPIEEPNMSFADPQKDIVQVPRSFQGQRRFISSAEGGGQVDESAYQRKLGRAKEAEAGTGVLSDQAQQLVQGEQQIQEKGQQLAAQVGQPLNTTELNEIAATKLNVGQAVSSGLAGGVAGGIAAGAVSGGAAAVPGAIAGFFGGLYKSIRSQISDEQTVAQVNLDAGTKNLNNLIKLANSNPGQAAEYMNSFNQQLAVIDRNYGKLKLESQNNLNKWLGKDGRIQLQNYANFYAGQRQFYIDRMREALATPDPTKAVFLPEDVQ